MSKHSSPRSLVWEQLAAHPIRLAHSIGVQAKVQAMSTHLPYHHQLTLGTAALLHDIGYGVTDASGLHFHDGAELLERIHRTGDAVWLTGDVVWLVRWHSTALWEAKDEGWDNLPDTVDDLPGATPERVRMLEVLTLADFTTGPDGLPVTLRERREGIIARYPDPANPVRVALDQGWPWIIDAWYRLPAGARAHATDPAGALATYGGR